MTTPLMTAEHARAMLELVGPGNHGGMRELLDAYRTVVALHEMLAGRDRSPTLAEVKAHEDKGGDWIYQPTTEVGEDALPPEAWYIFATADDELFGRHFGHNNGRSGRVYKRLPEGRWWAWNSGIVAWPEVTK